jgi:DNA-binding LacI/PurR family transcriptional regulator
LLGLGHKRIGFLAGPLENCPDHINRRQAYLDAMERAGLPPLVVDHSPTERTADAGHRQCLQLLRQPEPPTAILTANDEMAYGALAACAELGFEVPGDISLMGFDDLPLSRYMSPPLSTVRQPVEQIGFTAAKCAALLARNSGEAPKSQTLPTELVLRSSTAAPRKEPRP